MPKVEIGGDAKYRYIKVAITPDTAYNLFSGIPPSEELTTLQAEQMIKELRSAIDKLRMLNRPKKKLGEY